MKFKLNDPVRIIATPSRHFDQVGTVTDVSTISSPDYPFRVSIEGDRLWFGAHELVLAERAEVGA